MVWYVPYREQDMFVVDLKVTSELAVCFTGQLGLQKALTKCE